MVPCNYLLVSRNHQALCLSSSRVVPSGTLVYSVMMFSAHHVSRGVALTLYSIFIVLYRT